MMSGFVYMCGVRFLSGFLAASLLWGGLSFAYLNGYLDSLLPADEVAEPVAAAVPADDGAGDAKTKRRVKRTRVRRRADSGGNGGSGKVASAGAAPQGTGTVGDDIGWDKERNVDMNGGEGQLAGSQIDAGFDSVMGRIRRCLILVESDGDVTGKLTFGMRVGSDGKPKAVNLSGPSIVIGGESGSCLRTAAQGIRFASFNGPDMLFKYPITLQ